MKIKIILTFTALFALCAPGAVFAEDDYFSPYAQVRFYTGVVNQSRQMSNTYGASGNVVVGKEGNADLEAVWKNVDARAGVKGKKGALEGVAEIGFGKDGQGAANTAVYTRLIYGTWTFMENMNIMFGQYEAPYSFYSSCATDNNSNRGFGTTNQDRDVQLRLTAYGIYIALLNPTIVPNTGTLPTYVPAKTTYAGIVDATSASTTEPVTITATTVAENTGASYIKIIIPKMAFGYDFKMKNEDIDLLIGAGIAGQELAIDKKNTADASKLQSTLNNKKIDSYLGYVHAKVKAGGFSVAGNFGYGQNTGNMGLRYDQGFTTGAQNLATKLPYKDSTGFMSSVAAADSTKTKLEDSISQEGYIDIGYDFGIIEPRCGYGFASTKSDSSGSKRDNQSQIFLQLNFPVIAKKLWLKPEVCYRDYAKDPAGNKQGSEWLAGIYIQANIE